MDRTLTSHTRLHSLLWILGLTLLISGSAIIAHTIYQTVSEKRPLNDRYLIRAIVQPNEALLADKIAQLLSLSTDHPVNLYNLDPKEATKILLDCPLIRLAKVKRLPPDALYVDVTLRTPCALVEDHPGMAIDGTGVLFPYQGSFEGPRVSLGTVQNPKTAVHLLQLLPDSTFVDISRLTHPRYGLRELVVGLENGSILRLPTHDYEQALTNYHKLKTSGPLIIDLRLPNLAYLTSL